MGARPLLSAPRRAVLGLLATLPALAVALYLLAGDLRALAAPVWPSSQPRWLYATIALLVKGTLLGGVALGVAGLARNARTLALAGVALLVAAGVPLLLGGAGAIVLLAAGMLFAAARIGTSPR